MARRVEDRVDGDGGLAGLAVADDELALAAADRNHRVDGLEARLQRLRNGLAVDDAGRFPLQRHVHLLSRNHALAVQRIAERIHDAAEHLLAHGDGSDAAGPAGGHALADLFGRAHEDGTDIFRLEVHRHGHDAALLELEELARFGAAQAIEPDHAVTDLQDLAGLFHVELCGHVPELSEKHFRKFAGLEVAVIHTQTILLFCSMNCRRIRLS